MSSASVEEVRNRLDIVDVISETVPLKKAGRTFKAPCPFHNERTPSFIVNPDRQTWHCFGACGVGGDVFSFVMKRENLDFGETLRTLADKVGVVLPTRDKAAESKSDRLLEANKAAAAFFQNQLLTSPAASQARDYIRQRGLSEQAVKDFQVGLLPPDLRRAIQAPAKSGIHHGRMRRRRARDPKRVGGNTGHIPRPAHVSYSESAGSGNRVRGAGPGRVGAQVHQLPSRPYSTRVRPFMRLTGPGTRPGKPTGPWLSKGIWTLSLRTNSGSKTWSPPWARPSPKSRSTY